jgi:hypothetical protein
MFQRARKRDHQNLPHSSNNVRRGRSIVVAGKPTIFIRRSWKAKTYLRLSAASTITRI